MIDRDREGERDLLDLGTELLFMHGNKWRLWQLCWSHKAIRRNRRPKATQSGQKVSMNPCLMDVEQVNLCPPPTADNMQ